MEEGMGRQHGSVVTAMVVGREARCLAATERDAIRRHRAGVRRREVVASCLALPAEA